MNESKYTPGPWMATNRYDDDAWEVRAETGEAITGWGRVRQTEANAQLIARSPDRQALLEKILPIIEAEAGRRDCWLDEPQSEEEKIYRTEMRDLADEIAAEIDAAHGKT